jgi:hypothetical protein
MTNSTTLPADQLLHVHKEIEIDAPLTVVFESLLEQLGPGFDTPDGKLMPFKLEAWPGGRWFRDLGNNSGHLWGFVQVIKPPTLLEITGPLFVSAASVSHIQYRLTERGNASTHLQLTHRALGEISLQHREGVEKGWAHCLARVKERVRR